MTGSTEAWRKMVLRAAPRPAWLAEPAPHGDVVLSTRVRYMRNLKGHRFVPSADDRELADILRAVLSAIDPSLTVYKTLTNAERDHFVLARLLSPEFPWNDPARALLIDPDQRLSIMVNEEDHLRVQALTAGWNEPRARQVADDQLRALSATLAFAWSPKFGYLAASPINCGAGRRISAMFHLIGLAHTKRLPTVVSALGSQGLVVRGLFGESSRAIGAYAQVSLLNGSDEDFAGACEYLLHEERSARGDVPLSEIRAKADQARDFAAASPKISLSDSLRILAWTRWAATANLDGFADDPRDIDAALTSLDVRVPRGEEIAAAERADTMRTILRT